MNIGLSVFVSLVPFPPMLQGFAGYTVVVHTDFEPRIARLLSGIASYRLQQYFTGFLPGDDTETHSVAANSEISTPKRPIIQSVLHKRYFLKLHSGTFKKHLHLAVIGLM